MRINFSLFRFCFQTFKYNNYRIMSDSTSHQSSSTLSSIIQQLQTSICKAKYEALEPSEGLVRYHKRWTPEEKTILAQLVKEYGSDFTHFKKFLPFKTRRQIQRGYEIHATRQLRLRKIMLQRERKHRFDVEVLGDDSRFQETKI